MVEWYDRMIHMFTDGHVAEKSELERLLFVDIAREMVIRVEQYKREKIRAERTQSAT